MAITPVTVHDLKALGGFGYVTQPATRVATAINDLITAVETPSDYKQSVRAATAAALAAYTRADNVITANANGALAAVDGVTLVVGDRILLKNGAAGADNGIYTVTSLGSAGTKWRLTRAADANTSALVTSGMLVPVEEGTANASTIWELSTANPITLNTTALTFTVNAGAINRDTGTIANLGAQAAGTSNKTAAADHVHAHGNQLGGTLHADAVAGVSAGFLSASGATKLAAVPLCDATFPSPTLGAGADLTASGVLKMAAGCTITRITLFPLEPWTIAAIDTSTIEVANATTAKSLGTLTFTGAPPVAGTPYDLTLNAVPADLVCAAGDVITLAITNSAAAASGAAHLQIVGA